MATEYDDYSPLYAVNQATGDEFIVLVYRKNDHGQVERSYAAIPVPTTLEPLPGGEYYYTHNSKDASEVGKIIRNIKGEER